MMQKKLLVTISDDLSFLHGVRFVGSFFRNKAVVNPTLFYVAPRPHVVGGDKGFGQPELDRKTAEAGQKKAQEALEAARRMLCDRGFPPENITCKFVFKQFGTVKDIIRESKTGMHDAVILGRRGYALFESVLSTSVTREILDRDIQIPIWICRRPDENRKNVLLCVDGSGHSLRMIDHVGFMLSDENEHAVTLFHVATGEGEDPEAILKEARNKLMENWFSDGRINSVVTSSTVTGVAKTILAETEAKGYAVVGVGRLGVDKGGFKEWLVGSRTMQLLDTIEKAALWVSS